MTSKIRLLHALTRSPQTVEKLAVATRLAEGRVRILAQALVDDGRAVWGPDDTVLRR